MRSTWLGALIALLLVCGVAHAQRAAPSSSGADLSALAQQSQNPMANLNTIPFQWNFNWGGGAWAPSP